MEEAKRREVDRALIEHSTEGRDTAVTSAADVYMQSIMTEEFQVIFLVMLCLPSHNLQQYIRTFAASTLRL